jgi:hypothetical protein
MTKEYLISQQLVPLEDLSLHRSIFYYFSSVSSTLETHLQGYFVYLWCDDFKIIHKVKIQVAYLY